MAGIRTRGRGELEADVLRILRDASGPIGASQVQDGFTENTPAYTTILTALDRLVDKGDVRRVEDSPRKVRFEATRSAVEDARDRMADALDAIEDRRAVLMAFTGALDDEDLEFLRSAVRKASS